LEFRGIPDQIAAVLLLGTVRVTHGRSHNPSSGSRKSAISPLYI